MTNYYKKYLKYKMKYLQLKGGMERVNSCDIPRDEGAHRISRYNTFFETHSEYLYIFLNKVLMKIQHKFSNHEYKLKPAKVMNIYIDQHNNKPRWNSEMRVSPYFVLVGGGALTLLSDFLAILNPPAPQEKHILPMKDYGPRTNDFDVQISFDVDHINEIILNECGECIIEECNTFSKECLADLISFSPDNTHLEHGEKEIIICGPENKIQISLKAGQKPSGAFTFTNIRINVMFSDGSRHHLFEFLLRDKYDMESSYNNILPLISFIGLTRENMPICMPSLYIIIMNYGRVLFRRGSSHLAKARQDYVRLKWTVDLCNFICGWTPSQKLSTHYPEKPNFDIFESYSTRVEQRMENNEIMISPDQLVNINILWQLVEYYLYFCSPEMDERYRKCVSKRFYKFLYNEENRYARYLNQTLHNFWEGARFVEGHLEKKPVCRAVVSSRPPAARRCVPSPSPHHSTHSRTWQCPNPLCRFTDNDIFDNDICVMCGDLKHP